MTWDLFRKNSVLIFQLFFEGRRADWLKKSTDQSASTFKKQRENQH
jgi:hypothetical protein